MIFIFVVNVKKFINIDLEFINLNFDTPQIKSIDTNDKVLIQVIYLH